MVWVLFTISSAALYAGSNFFDKFLIEKRVRDPMILAILGGFLTCLVGLVVLIFRAFPPITSEQLIYVLVAGALFELALVPWYRAISLDDVSRVAPIFQSIPVLVLIMSYLFLGERLLEKQLFGFIFILIGGYLLAAEELSLKTFKIRKAFWWALLSSLLFAVPLILFKRVSLDQGFWDSLAYEFLGAGIGGVILFLFVIFSRRDDFKKEVFEKGFKSWTIIGVNELIYIGARMLNFYAIALAPVSLVTVLGGFQPFFLLLFGFVLSNWFPNIVKEDISRSIVVLKFTAIVLIFTGVWFINN